MMNTLTKIRMRQMRGRAAMLILKNSRTAEQQADSLGMQMLGRAGYNPRGMIAFLQTIERHSGGRSVEFLSSHPNPSNRIARLEKQLSGSRR